MKSFNEYLLSEAALDKKIKKGFSETPVDIPDAEVIHHDPETKTTIYHLKKPKAAYAFGGGTSWCTNSPKRQFAHEYLRKKGAKLFGIMKGVNRYQAYFRGKTPIELRDKNNNSPMVSPIDHTHIAKMADTPHKPFKGRWKPPPHPISQMSKPEIIDHVKGMSAGQRVLAYKSIHYGPDHHSVSYNTDDESTTHRAIASRLDTNDLHHFHDDPEHSSYIATHATLDHIADKMKDHPDPETRKIVRGRIQRAGGESNMIKPAPESPTIPHPDQTSFKFSFKRKKK